MLSYGSWMKMYFNNIPHYHHGWPFLLVAIIIVVQLIIDGSIADGSMADLNNNNANTSCVDYSCEYSNPHFIGNRRVMTHLMEWKYEDIAQECERFLGPYGYGGVQVSPVNEHAILERRPWYERYQPVSYVIQTRSGNEQQFRDMVHRCNQANVRIYVDVVLNHMTGGQRGVGTAGNAYDGDKQEYPGVPFGPEHFNGSNTCPTKDLEVHDFNNPLQSRNCRLFGLRDLDQSQEYVRQKQIDFLNKLIDCGVAGFRSDASTHMWPHDLKVIFSRLNNLNESYFPPGSRPFIYHETIYYGGDGINSMEYTSLGRIIEFRFYKEITNVFRGNNSLKWLRNFGQEWSLVPSQCALVMIDSHDLRVGHNGQLGFNINCFEPRLLKVSTAFMLAWNYGVPRVMSSYYWNQTIKDGKDLNEWVGPPTDDQGRIISVRPVRINEDDLSCNKEYICEHRWRQIYNMVRFKSIVGDDPMENWWDNGDYQIAFSRGNRGFIAINLQQGQDLRQRLQTGLPGPAIYCDIVSGNLKGTKCTGKTIVVDREGYADIFIGHEDFDAFMATHIEARIT